MGVTTGWRRRSAEAVERERLENLERARTEPIPIVVPAQRLRVPEVEPELEPEADPVGGPDDEPVVEPVLDAPEAALAADPGDPGEVDAGEPSPAGDHAAGGAATPYVWTTGSARARLRRWLAREQIGTDSS